MTMQLRIHLIFLLTFLAISIDAQVWERVGNWCAFPFKTLAVSENTIYAGSNGSGIFISENNGGTWTKPNNTISNLDVQSLAAIGDTVIAGSKGIVCISIDKGKSWRGVSSGLNPGWTISALLITENEIYAGTRGFGGGVFTSSKNCLTWSAANNGLAGLYITSLTESGGSIFAGTDGNGVFLSTNHAGSWSTVNSGLNNLNILSLAAKESRVFVGTKSKGVFFSINNGTTWNTFNTGLTDSCILSLAINGDTIYAATSDGIFLSTINDASWKKISLWQDYTYSLAVNGSHIFAATGNTGDFASGGRLLVSGNSGATWTNGVTWLTSTKTFTLIAHGDSIISGMGGGGVFLATNKGDNWTEVHNHLTKLTATRLAVNENTIYAGTSEGVFISQNNDSVWTKANFGITDSIIKALTIFGNTILAGTYKGIFLSSDNCQSWTEANTGLPVNPDVRDIVVKGNNLFAATYGTGVFLSTDTGLTWMPINAGLTYKTVLCFAVSKDKLFAGTSGGVYLSTDNGASWTAKNLGLTYKFILSLAADEDNIFAGTDGGGVFLFKINDTMWNQINAGLTSTTISSLAISDNNIFAGTDGGVFRTGIANTLIHTIKENGLANELVRNTFSVYNTLKEINVGYVLSSATQVDLNIYNLSGKCIASLINKRQASGKHTLFIPKDIVSTGTYIIRLKTIKGQKEKVIIVIK